MNIKKCLLFLSLFLISSSLWSAPVEWFFLGISQEAWPEISKPLPLIMITKSPDARGTPLANHYKPFAKTLVSREESRIFILRIARGDTNEDIPVIIKGGIGLVVPKSSEREIQDIWEHEDVVGLNEEGFKRALIEASKNLSAFENKGEEQRFSFGGGNFNADLAILMNDRLWKKLSENKIRAGFNIPSQRGRVDEPWSCGPNSGARSLQMLDRIVTNFDLFVAQCPKSWSFIWDVGPTPNQLGDYLRSSGTRYPVYAEFDDEFQHTFAGIKWSVDHNRPHIVLIVRSFNSMHYVNVIGYNDTSKRVAIMDTDHVIYWMSYSELEKWLNQLASAISLL